MATLGHIEEFLPGKTPWQQYKERLDFFFAANDITEAIKQRAVFLSVCGPALYSVIRSLCTPDTPDAVEYNVILEKLNLHFSPKPSEILCRYKFHKRDQRPNETVADFLAEIRRLSEHCNFEAQLDSMLRDRLVCGLRDEVIQRKLLADPKLTLSSAMDQALAGEAALHHAQEIRGNYTSVNYVKNNKGKNTAQTKGDSSKKKLCHRCGTFHPFNKCKFTNAVCHFCKKIGHIQKMCNAKINNKSVKNNIQPTGKVHVLEINGENNNFNLSNKTVSPEIYDTFNNLHSISSVGEFPPNEVTVKLNGLDHLMEIDSGSLHSVISSSNFVKLWPVNPPKLLPVSDQSLRTWSSEKLEVKGFVNVNVSTSAVEHELPLLVIEGKGKSLIGRSWFQALGIEIAHKYPVSYNHTIQSSVEFLLQKYESVFSDSLGTFKGPPVSIKLDENSSPRFLKARTVPFALRDRVTKELENMVTKGVLEPISYSDWATPIVPVVKKNGSIRICGDYRSTVNQSVKQFTYPLPTVNEVMSTVTGGTIFSKIDLSEAYLQLPVDEQTSRILTLNTHKGLFKVNRLPFGVSVAVSIFQKRMEEVLAGIDGVLPYLDDIFIKGIGIEDHNKRLEQVLQRLEKEGIHLKREKCAFMVPEIELLGFRVNKRGIQPTPDKVAAIHRAPTPKNVTELQAFLGLLNFYGCFLKNRSNVLEPLHQLLQKDAQWCWTHIHDKSYKAAKELLQEDHTLAHFDENLPVILTCDASSYGVGAVLGHELPEGKEVPIAYYSRTLAKAERNYSQTDKEALAVISAVKKFHQYLFGRRFKIITDHKPLLGLLSPTKPLPQMVSPRVLRWSLSLSAYEYEIEYRKGKQIVNADALSRLPVSSTDFEIPAPPGILLLEASTDIQIDAKLLASVTQKDPILSRISLWILNGWPDKAEDEKFKPYFSRKDELSVHQNCVLWGSRVVIPESLRNEVLILLHASHPGIVRMKGLARSYVWWPKMDHQIEVAVKSCHICQSFQKFPPKAPLHPWEWTERPWSRIHIDFAGPFYGQTFFIVVDSHSKWLEVLPVSSMSSATAIMNLRSLFATHGLCDTIVSDNGSTFTSSEFRDFLRKNQIRQILVAPYHPSSNGQAERMVATTKDALKRIIHGSWKARLARFLFSQHTLPCTTTGRTPAELLMNRRLTSLLDRLHPDLNKTMKEKEDNASKSHSEKRSRAFSVNDPVYIRNYSSGAPWTPATILESTGPLSYRAKTVDGEISKRHVDQIRSRLVLEGNNPELPPSLEAPQLPDSHDPDSEVPCPDRLPTVAETGDSPSLPQEKLALPPVVHDAPRRSSRPVSRPKYLDDYVLQLMREGVSCPELLSHLYSPTDGL